MSMRTSILRNFIEIALWHGCSPVNLLHVFRTLLPNSTSGGLLLNAGKVLSSIKFFIELQTLL